MMRGMRMETSTRDARGWRTRLAPVWLGAGFWVCVVIAVAVVLRRVFALASPSRSGPAQMAALDAVFASHAALTLAHILPALLFVLVCPFVVLRRFAGLTWAERVFFPLGVVVGLTAYAMSVYPVGGWTERSAVLFFNSLFLFALGRAYWYRRIGDAISKRRWVLRACDSAGDCDDTSGDGCVFCDELADAPGAGAVFWDCVLDWVLGECDCD